MNNKKNNDISLYLSIIVILNIIPIGVMNLLTKKSIALPQSIILIIFVIQTGLLFSYFIRTKIVVNKNYFILFILYITITLIYCMIQYINNSMEIQDIYNLITKFITVSTLIIFIEQLSIDEEKLIKFLKIILIIAIVACVYNMIYYSTEILSIAKLSSSYDVNIKSFFSNRNQFAQFLFVAIVADSMLMETDKSWKYKIYFIFILLNMIFTMSRTALMITAIFLIINFIIKQNTKKNLVKSILLLIILLCISLLLYNKYSNIINSLFIRSDNIENASGRTGIWETGIDIVLNNNIIMGVGRFTGIKILNNRGYDFTQFHSIYIEALVNGGILELLLLILVLGILMKRLLKSNMPIGYKKKWIVTIICFGILGIFESINRFSIGYVDTMYTVFFITIPLLFTNSYIKDKEK